MPTVRDLLSALDVIAPAHFAPSWDRIGLQVGSLDAEVTGVHCVLDLSREAIEAAVAAGENVIVGHHPLIWDPLKRVVEGERTGDLVTALIRHGVAFVAAHTNWDAAHGGVNDVLAERIGLIDVQPFGGGEAVGRVKVVTFAPEEAVPGLLDAMSGAGAGVIGAYSRCAFLNSGTGTFRAEAGAQPVIGAVGSVTETPEVRIEMVADEARLGAVVAALRGAHPYEEPAYDVIPLVPESGQAFGRVGRLPVAMAVEDFVAQVNAGLETVSHVWLGQTRIQRVAVLGGAGSFLVPELLRGGVDAFVTGELPHNLGVDLAHAGVTALASGHRATEEPAMPVLEARLRAMLL